MLARLLGRWIEVDVMNDGSSAASKHAGGVDRSPASLTTKCNTLHTLLCNVMYLSGFDPYDCGSSWRMLA
jgi:hypothetical protein